MADPSADENLGPEVPFFEGDAYAAPMLSRRDLSKGAAKTVTVSIVGGPKDSDGKPEADGREHIYHIQVGDEEFMLKSPTGRINEEVTIPAPPEGKPIVILAEGKRDGRVSDTQYCGDELSLEPKVGANYTMEMKDTDNDHVGNLSVSIVKPDHEIQAEREDAEPSPYSFFPSYNYAYAIPDRAKDVEQAAPKNVPAASPNRAPAVAPREMKRVAQ